ncbi:amidoligase family protein [Candidatus Dojkabacteria bacterium]|nr:amidoligase family protein [Candidatus Dojkabacteria bacterium]
MKKVEKETESAKLCYDCASEITDSNSETGLDNEIRCNICHAEKYTSCDSCADILEKETAIYSNNDYKYYCNDCYRDRFISCDSCSEETSIDDYYSVNDESLCQSCYEENCINCDSCGESEYTDNSNYCENCEEDYCNGCWDTHGCNNRVLANFQFLTGKICKEMPFFDYVGIEIETFGEENAPKLDFISTTGDGSITPDNDFAKGIEFKTLPASGKVLVKNIRLLSKELKKANFKVNQSCGLHVHIDCRKIKDKPQKLSNMILTYYAFEDILYSMLPKSRWNNQYCKPLFTDYIKQDLKGKTIDRLGKKWYKSEYYEGNADDHSHSSRYHDFNIHSIFYRGTLEVRMHSATINSEKILNWIYLLLKIKKWALNNYDEKIIQKALKLNSNKDKYSLFIKTFKLNNNPKLKKYIEKRIKKFNPLVLTKKQNYWGAKKETIKIQTNYNRLYLRKRKYIDDAYNKLINTENIRLKPFERALLSYNQDEIFRSLEKALIKDNLSFKLLQRRLDKQNNIRALKQEECEILYNKEKGVEE